MSAKKVDGHPLYLAGLGECTKAEPGLHKIGRQHRMINRTTSTLGLTSGRTSSRKATTSYSWNAPALDWEACVALSGIAWHVLLQCSICWQPKIVSTRCIVMFHSISLFY